MTTLHLPQIHLQHDFAQVFADVRDNTIIAEDIYLSCYQTGSQSVHGKVNVSKDNSNDILLEARDGVDLKRTGPTSFTASCPALNISNAPLLAPRQVININPTSGTSAVRRISAFDVSPNGELIATGFLDGSVQLQSSSSLPSTTYEGTVTPTSKKVHLSNVTSLRFFPSSAVLLSAAADFTLNIISAASSDTFPVLSVPRTLKGHTRAITDTAIIGRGKNVLSCGKDGTLRLWDVGEAKKLSTMSSERFSPIMQIAIGEGEGEGGATSPSTDFLPLGSTIYAALQSGSFNRFDLRTRNMTYASSIFSTPNDPGSGRALHSIAHHPSKHLLATGSASGVVALFDTRNLPSSTPSPQDSAFKPLYSFSRSASAISNLNFAPSSSNSQEAQLLIAPDDGFPCAVAVYSEGPRVATEFVGGADEPIRIIRWREGDIWTAGDEGLVRKY